MFRAFHSARTKSLLMGVALATGTAVGVAGFAAPAFAKEKQAKPSYSKAFVAAYEPVNKAFTDVPEGGDYSAVKGQLPGVVSAVESEDDRMAAGQLTLLVGNKAKDPALQRQGLEMMLKSGKVAPEQVGQFQFFVGNLAYQAEDYAAAHAALEAALAAGYQDDQANALILETYFHQNQNAEGLAYIKDLATKGLAAGQPVPEAWLLRSLQVAYTAKLSAQANEIAGLLVDSYPTEKNWQAALQVVREVNQFNPEEVLDLGRLMMVSGGMQKDYDLKEYLEAADPRKLSNEVLSALDEATAAGVIQANAPAFAEYRQIAQERAATDRADAAKAVGQTPANGTAALGTADLLLSVGNYAGAEAMYQTAIDKGGIDVNRALTRKGIAQVRQGKAAEAKATFAQIQGSRATLAQLWSIYADEKGSSAGG